MEAIMLHTDRNKEQAWDRAVEMLKLVNVNSPEKRMWMRSGKRKQETEHPQCTR